LISQAHQYENAANFKICNLFDVQGHQFHPQFTLRPPWFLISKAHQIATNSLGGLQAHQLALSPSLTSIATDESSVEDNLFDGCCSPV
jgi:hypothetical protein